MYVGDLTLGLYGLRQGVRAGNLYPIPAWVPFDYDALPEHERRQPLDAPESAWRLAHRNLTRIMSDIPSDRYEVAPVLPQWNFKSKPSPILIGMGHNLVSTQSIPGSGVPREAQSIFLWLGNFCRNENCKHGDLCS